MRRPALHMVILNCGNSQQAAPLWSWSMGIQPALHFTRCVCQWAFASYIARAGGCDKIQSLVCDATNMVALTAYREAAPNDPKIADALACLERRCGGASAVAF